MHFNKHPYRKISENNVPENEIDKSETGKREKHEEPSDSYCLVYLTFGILGMTTSLPAYFFTVANEYWMYKFRDAKNETLKLNPLQVSFTAYVGLALSIPLPICCIINIFINEKISCQKRIIGSLIIMLILFSITTVLVEIDTTSWQYGFLVVTLSIILLLSATGGILLSTVSGIVSKFPSKYIAIFVLGQGASGIFSSLAEVVSLTVGVSPKTNGLIYFVIGCFTILVALTTYVIQQGNKYFNYFLYCKDEVGINTFENHLLGISKISHYKLIFKKIWHYILCTFIVVCASASITPGVTVLIKSYGTGTWSDYYFVAVTTFLLPSIADCSARLLSIFIEWPRNRYVLILLNVIRIGTIPFTLFCNLQPRGELPVIFDSDVYYIVFNAIFGFSNGYLLNISMMNIPKEVEQHEKYSAGLITGIIITLAFNIGNIFSVMLIKLI